MLRNNACKKICKSRFVKNKHCVKRYDATKDKRWKNFQTFYYARWKKCEKSVWIKSVYKFLKMNYYSSFLNWNEIFVNNVTRAKWKNIFAEPKEILEIESRKEGSGFTFSADLFKCNINADYAFFLFFFYPQVGQYFLSSTRNNFLSQRPSLAILNFNSNIDGSKLVQNHRLYFFFPSQALVNYTLILMQLSIQFGLIEINKSFFISLSFQRFVRSLLCIILYSYVRYFVCFDLFEDEKLVIFRYM